MQKWNSGCRKVRSEFLRNRDSEILTAIGAQLAWRRQRCQGSREKKQRCRGKKGKKEKRDREERKKLRPQEAMKVPRCSAGMKLGGVSFLRLAPSQGKGANAASGLPKPRENLCVTERTILRFLPVDFKTLLNKSPGKEEGETRGAQLVGAQRFPYRQPDQRMEARMKNAFQAASKPIGSCFLEPHAKREALSLNGQEGEGGPRQPAKGDPNQGPRGLQRASSLGNESRNSFRPELSKPTKKANRPAIISHPPTHPQEKTQRGMGGSVRQLQAQIVAGVWPLRLTRARENGEIPAKEKSWRKGEGGGMLGGSEAESALASSTPTYQRNNQIGRLFRRREQEFCKATNELEQQIETEGISPLDLAASSTAEKAGQEASGSAPTPVVQRALCHPAQPRARGGVGGSEQGLQGQGRERQSPTPRRPSRRSLTPLPAFPSRETAGGTWLGEMKGTREGKEIEKGKKIEEKGSRKVEERKKKERKREREREKEERKKRKKKEKEERKKERKEREKRKERKKKERKKKENSKGGEGRKEGKRFKMEAIRML
ncbi:hypothetical protein NXF25_018003 [Crotalus adamanteus]|uniref:Uncharacterized protein n=1 Tax=Crotalus adamanteus TaxID=8729 RepID=A0AAW1APY6_CROAD